ncbi:MAG: hypothetical protein KDH97_08530 [Calditrichaeota bacterium]|nr:hypothetical protein [Calditrichota bacterium]
MKPISEHIVDSAWQEMAGLEIDEIRAMVDKMSEEQPYVLVYLMAAGEEGFSDEEREILLYIGMVVWRIMSQGNAPLPQVDEQMLDTAEAANFEMLEALDRESPGDFIAVAENMLNQYNQLEVLKYIVEAIMEEGDDEEAIDIEEDNKGWMLIVLKTIVDCFDAN